MDNESFRELSLALVGIGGYGGYYASVMLDAAASTGTRLVAAVDPFPESSTRYQQLVARRVPIYRTLDDLYAACDTAPPQLVVVSSPIHLHCGHTVEALSHGTHVLCEKPVCVMPEQAVEMMRARDVAGRQVAVGYQW